jgi:hypothetical protein
MSAPVKQDRELAILWDRLSIELQGMSEQAQQIAMTLSRKTASLDETSQATNLLQSLRNCTEVAKGARGLMHMSIRQQSRRYSA